MTAVPEIKIEMPSLDSYDELASVTQIDGDVGGAYATTDNGTASWVEVVA